MHGTAAWHLRRLVRAGVVEGLAAPGARLYFVSGAMARAEEKRRAALLRRRPNAAFLQTLREAPGARLSEVARRLGIAKSTASRRAAILLAAGLVVAQGGRLMPAPDAEDPRGR